MTQKDRKDIWFKDFLMEAKYISDIEKYHVLVNGKGISHYDFGELFQKYKKEMEKLFRKSQKANQ